METAQEIKRYLPNVKRGKKTVTNLHCVETKNGYFLTLRERQIMKLITDEATDRVTTSPPGANIRQEMKNVYSLLGDYIAAFERGQMTLSDIERCG